MFHLSVGSWLLKSIAGVAAVAVCAVSLQSSAAEATRGSHVSEPRAVESPNCRRTGSSPEASGDRRQTTVSVPATVFLRVDKSGLVTAAATNTGCAPSKNDDVFIFRPDGTIEPTTAINVDGCKWRGDFTVAARFQPQKCRADQH